MQAAFKAHIETHFPEFFQQRLLLACSGGLDSVVLVHLCDACKLDFAIAHCNFGLRGAESDADTHFVEALAHTLTRPVYITHFDTLGYVSGHQVSVQMAARELRYRWFSRILKENGIDLLLTAHHADDQIETFLINLSRGTGLEGLTGIPAKGPGLARPLLPFTRERILEFAKSQHLNWREDRSNEDAKYLRNKIRLELVPRLKELHPAFDDNFQKTLTYLSGSAALLSNYREFLKKQWFKGDSYPFRIPVEPLLKLDPLQDYLHFLFADYGFKDGAAVEGLMSAGSGKWLASKEFRLVKDRDYLLLQELPEEVLAEYTVPAEKGSLKIPLAITLEEVGKMDALSPDILYVDKETLNPVLTLRKWRKGDYFYPLGMKGRKKVAKYFKDEKMDLIAKENQWLLCSGNEIVWIVGRRADERFKVRDTTNAILKVTYKA